MNIQHFNGNNKEITKTRKTYQDKYNQKIHEYAKYLYPAYLGALSWRPKQIKINSDPPFLANSYGIYFECLDEANYSNNFRTKVDWINGTSGPKTEIASLQKHIKSCWFTYIATVYYHKTGIEKVLENWLSRCKSRTLPSKWKTEIYKDALHKHIKLVRIRAKFGKAAGKYLTQKHKDLHLKSASKNNKAEQLFLLQPLDRSKGIFVLRSIGYNMGGFLSNKGEDSLSIQYYQTYTEQWILVNDDLSKRKINTPKAIMAGITLDKINLTIACKDSDNRSWYLSHQGHNLGLKHSAVDITCKYWVTEEVDFSKPTVI